MSIWDDSEHPDTIRARHLEREIERLQGNELSRAQVEITKELTADVDRLTADNERLRAALLTIAGGTEDIEPPFRAVPIEYLRRWAREALDHTYEQKAL